MHFGEIDDDRKDRHGSSTHIQSQLGRHRRRGLAICTFHPGFCLGLNLVLGRGREAQGSAVLQGYVQLGRGAGAGWVRPCGFLDVDRCGVGGWHVHIG